MSGATADPRLIGARAAPRKALRLSWSDPVFRAIVWQVVIVGFVVLLAWYLIGNTNRNLAARHIATGFGFLGRVAGIPIGESPIPYNPAVDTYGTALIIGILNTLQVAVVGIVLATILGTLIGIGRLSNNFLLARLTALYVETLRDIPLLLQLLLLVLDPADAAAAPAVLAHRPTALPLQPRRAGSRNWTGILPTPGALAGFIAGRRRHRRYGAASRGGGRTRPGSDRQSGRSG